MRHLLILLAAAALCACADTTPKFDSRFGIDTRLTLAQQILHRDAGANTDPVEGMDGRSARAVYERYQKAGGEQPQAPIMSGSAK